jgi:hypothetical protein
MKMPAERPRCNILGTTPGSKLQDGASVPEIYRFDGHRAGPMSLSVDALWKMSDVELLAAYDQARRQFVEKKFSRDTQRARLAWIKARMFVGSSGGVTERNMAIDVSEEIARKGQELREMTRDLDLLKVDVDIIATVIRLRSAPAAAATQGEDATESDPEREDA